MPTMTWRSSLNFKAMKSLLTVGEQSIFLEIRKMVELAISANIVMKDAIVAYGESKPLQDQAQKIRLLERQSDEASFRLREQILDGAISPNVLDNLLECIETADSILDDYYYVSRELTRMRDAGLGIESSDIKTEFSIHESQFDLTFSELLVQADSALAVLAKLLTSKNMDDTIKLRKEIENIEQQGDETKDVGFDKLYAIAEKISYLQFAHYSELLHKFDDILDSCENISDLVLSIITSISR